MKTTPSQIVPKGTVEWLMPNQCQQCSRNSGHNHQMCPYTFSRVPFLLWNPFQRYGTHLLCFQVVVASLPLVWPLHGK